MPGDKNFQRTGRETPRTLKFLWKLGGKVEAIFLGFGDCELTMETDVATIQPEAVGFPKKTSRCCTLETCCRKLTS
jgi:hypothetical protein